MDTRCERRRRGTAWWPIFSVLVVLGLCLSACGADAAQLQAQRSHDRLDSELHHAQQMGIPDSMLKPIETQEASIASGQGGWGYSYDNAARNYDLLYNQLLGIEQQSLQTLQQQAITNIGAFSSLLAERKNQGFTEVADYQARLSKAFQDLNSAKTPGDYANVAQFAQTQTQALEAMWPAYLKLQDFRKALDALKQVSIPVEFGWASDAYAQDLVVFRGAASPDRYQRLQLVIEGQIAQLVADQPLALPYVGAAELAQFQSQITLLNEWDEQTGAFQQQHDTDARELQQAKTLADYITLAQVISQQTAAMVLPFARGQARSELNTLQALVSTYQAENPLEVYEYADPARGIGDVQGQFSSAAYSWDPVGAYELAYAHTHQLVLNVRAMHDNLFDPTPASKPHASDIALMQAYGILGGQVTIVSLREQTLRMYQNGKLVNWSYVTTGRQERPSPPGLHYAYSKAAHIEFQPTEPIGSPIRGFPTPINFAVYYADYGFFIHDGWWRTSWGPGTNLPHWDPAAFNGGSHGCINLPWKVSNFGATMDVYYNWVQVGTPVVVY